MTSLPRDSDVRRGPFVLFDRRLRQAGDFAQQATGHRVVEPWMLATSWCLHVGCDECVDLGVQAPCWGQTVCHGYTNGCGCIDCAARQAYDIEVATRRGASTEAGRAA
jgi:hypothetical protein